LIRLRSVTKCYPDGHQALHGVDLDVGEGMLGILGPNGAGKTTLLSILVLALEPTAGERDYHGLNPARSRDRGRVLADIGYLPQEFFPVAHLTGSEYLTHCARLRGVPLSRARLARRVHDLLDAVGLADAAHRRSGQYSGGMRRRLGLAQSLIHAPSLLVVDEPTAGLDPEERIRFRNLVAEVAERTAVLLSTHIVEDIEATCPRLVVIAAGRVLFDDAPAKMLQRAAGRLWELAEADVGPEHTIVERRIGRRGRPGCIVQSERPLPDWPQPRLTLELAYASFLVEHGCSIEPDAVESA